MALQMAQQTVGQTDRRLVAQMDHKWVGVTALYLVVRMVGQTAPLSVDMMALLWDIQTALR